MARRSGGTTGKKDMKNPPGLLAVLILMWFSISYLGWPKQHMQSPGGPDRGTTPTPTIPPTCQCSLKLADTHFKFIDSQETLLLY
jgi:hypothetical protein